MQPNNRSAFTSKSVETKTKKKMVPANDHQADISIWPVGDKDFGVAVKHDGKPMQSMLCDGKKGIISYLEKVL
jgi:hypothetical protein